MYMNMFIIIIIVSSISCTVSGQFLGMDVLLQWASGQSNAKGPLHTEHLVRELELEEPLLVVNYT